MKFVNLTPRDVHVYDEATGKIILVIEASGSVASVPFFDEQCRTLSVSDSTILVCRIPYEKPRNLPEPEDGVMLIVDEVVATAAAVHGRSTADLLIPRGSVRDEKGIQVGYTWFSQV